MLEKCADSMTEFLFMKCSLDESRKSVYRYGFQLFLSTSASTTAILLLSALFSLFGHAVIFLLIFMPLRFFSGGYHAKTYGSCFILTNAVYWLTATASLLFDSFPANVQTLIIPFLTVASAVTICLLVPVRNVNHPLSEARYRRNQITSRVLTPLIAILVCSLCLLQSKFMYLPIISFTLTAVAVMMIIPKLQERRA